MNETDRELTWVITGASQGFGRGGAVTRRNGGRGGTRADVGTRLARALPGLLSVVAADLREAEEVEKVAEVATRQLGSPDVLVNNAGRAIVGAAEEVSPAELRELMELNFFRCRGIDPCAACRDAGALYYVKLVDQGEQSVPERLDMLREHRDTIRRRIRELTVSLVATEYKIATYGGHTGEEQS